MRIKALPLAVVNQIAAGEAIERPASVVKELLENALDAKADSIQIEVHYGGLNQIRISDNGLGIFAEDLPLAVAPHATSKIREFDDLYAIQSMGFRGEALASIASIAKFSIISKTAEQAHAMKLLIDEDQNARLEPCARNQGTTVDVQDIFFNVPVRKKFLKTERIEFQMIEGVVKRFALSAPHIAIDLSHNTKKVLQLSSAQCDKSRLERIQKVLGGTFIAQAQYVEVEHGGIKLFGWIGGADCQRSQNDRQWIYVNGRMVKDKLLSHAIKQGYEQILYPGRYPVCLLYLLINPDEVDVNVHPTKHEVRFHQARWVHDLISNTINQVLDAPNSSDTSYLSYPSDFSEFTESTESTESTETTESIEFTNPTDSADCSSRSPLPALSNSEHYLSSESSFQAKSDLIALKEPFAIPAIYSKAETQRICEPALKFDQSIKSSLVSEDGPSWINLNKTFILMWVGEKPILVDTPTLHRHHLTQMLNQIAFPLESRSLLVPISHTYKQISEGDFAPYESILNQLGINLSWIAEKTLLIRSLPVMIPHLDLKLLLNKLLSQPASELQIVEFVVQCQDFNPQYASQEEKENLINTMRHIVRSEKASDSKDAWWKHLSTELCWNLLRA